MHVKSAKELRNVLTGAVIRTYFHPMIEPAEEEYESADGKESAFVIRDSFAGDYIVHIKRLSTSGGKPGSA